MKVLLYTDHQYPAQRNEGTGLHPREYPSGSGYHLHDLLARGLAEEGHEVFYNPRQGAACSLPSGVTLVADLPLNVDVCHSLTGPPGFATPVLEFSARHGKACLLTCHMLREGTTSATNWIFVSKSLARLHGSNRVVLNGLDPDDYIFSETKQDYFLFMGTMDKAIDKGLDRALALSRSEGFPLVVAGTARSYERIRYVADLCAAAGAEYIGDVRGPQKAELIAGARAVLFPSRLNEGCPLVILEAMLSGTPVISSDRGGSAEIVTPETGVLCASDDEWGPALNRLSEISPLRCREIGVEKYHYRRMVTDYLREYRCELESTQNKSSAAF
jgi:glycosyltransferase involved in cell wall biosynthesis